LEKAAMSRRDPSLHVQNAAIANSDASVEVRPLSMKVRWRMVVEVQDNQNSVDDGDGWHRR
jgi:hypothetical protein